MNKQRTIACVLASMIALIIVMGAAQADEVDELIATLQYDEYAQNRADAAFELGELGDNRAIDPLVNALQTDTSSEARASAASSLGTFEDDRALQNLITAIKEDENADVRLYAVWALRNFEDRSVDTLIYTLDDKNANVRGSAATALGEIGSMKAIPGLCEMVRNDGDINIRVNTIYVLARLKDPMVVDCLVDALSDPVVDIRSGAAQVLGELGDPRAIPYLNKSLSDPNQFVRSDAASAIEAINTPKETPLPGSFGALALGLIAFFRRMSRRDTL